MQQPQYQHQPQPQLQLQLRRTHSFARQTVGQLLWVSALFSIHLHICMYLLNCCTDCEILNADCRPQMEGGNFSFVHLFTPFLLFFFFILLAYFTWELGVGVGRLLYMSCLAHTCVLCLRFVLKCLFIPMILEVCFCLPKSTLLLILIVLLYLPPSLAFISISFQSAYRFVVCSIRLGDSPSETLACDIYGSSTQLSATFL